MQVKIAILIEVDPMSLKTVIHDLSHWSIQRDIFKQPLSQIMVEFIVRIILAEYVIRYEQIQQTILVVVTKTSAIAPLICLCDATYITDVNERHFAVISIQPVGSQPVRYK